ncbi:DUF1707 domain-containing protein [Actinomadura sp. KC216]|uniref:DUF1707 SHOCT-like domain-containing protein n=1 Tax=Actinomadura sp. KC216 TaxID=2530370 RepID=UPI00104DE5D4|nr:DUF1707 domain-containing protein [Actinomadura sp. KC216]TDB80107.1 DUF1707 domain-containing protein [Actinomadura sp. KC216]
MSAEQQEAQAVRASDGDRDEMLVRLHTAFAVGRLSEAELDERIDRVLAARTHGQLWAVAADLPSEDARVAPAGSTLAPAGRLQVAYKGSLKRAGRWRLPERCTVVVYKGTGLIDLRGAELDAQVTELRVIAYKSTVEIVVPPGVRVEAGGMGVCAEVHGTPSAGAPVVNIRGFAYKGAIEVKDRIRRA